jgi:sugar phosphate isomerase/epimerase
MFMTRRESLGALSAVSGLFASNRKMKMHFTPGPIGVKVGQLESIELAAKYGWEAVEPQTGYLAKLSDEEMAKLNADIKAKGLVWGNAGMGVNFRGLEDEFAAAMKGLPGDAKALQRAGVTRCSTWLSPAHPTLTYRQNFAIHARRLREIAGVLQDHGIRLGLEYVGPKTSWTSRRYAFIHTMAETKELLSEIARPNVGFLMDSWHWYTAQETEGDLLTLTNEQIVSVDLNDAPAGIPVEQQVDSRRELPAATGVIPVGAFLNALHKLGYDGPVRPEPFNAALRALPKEEAVARTTEAMKKAFALIQ